jgi:hypothetical protein
MEWHWHASAINSPLVSTTNKPRSTTRDPSAFEYVEKKRKRDAYLANVIKRKKEREEKFRKQDEEEAKKKEQEEALKKQKDFAAPTQTRPIQKAASRSNPPAEPPKKKI